MFLAGVFNTDMQTLGKMFNTPVYQIYQEVQNVLSAAVIDENCCMMNCKIDPTRVVDHFVCLPFAFSALKLLLNRAPWIIKLTSRLPGYLGLLERTCSILNQKGVIMRPRVSPTVVNYGNCLAFPVDVTSL